ncbi:MAG: carboxypeptidase-like regulatory domain-containing protein, partial [Muribaculaceae bacterium]|nr:carboxypeptidase-like regulatory domain-containing protein [Muribaculaceae bacterium]
MKRSYGQTLLFLLMGLLLSVSAYAQDISVKGVVQDSNGDPLVGATVAVKGTQTAVATNIDGKFSVKAPKGGAVIVTYIGYDPVEMFVTEAPMVIVMNETTELLDEVVVLGYGAEQRKQD